MLGFLSLCENQPNMDPLFDWMGCEDWELGILLGCGILVLSFLSLCENQPNMDPLFEWLGCEDWELGILLDIGRLTLGFLPLLANRTNIDLVLIGVFTAKAVLTAVGNSNMEKRTR